MVSVVTLLVVATLKCIMPPKEIPGKSASLQLEKQTSGNQGGKSGGKKNKSERSSTSAASTSSGKAAGPSSKAKVFTKKKRPLQPIEVLFGEKLVNASGDTMLSKRLDVQHGVIGLYFGAKWCPPCKTLLAELLLLYEEVKKTEWKFEMIFVSFDNSEVSFNDYFANMPWWAMGFEDPDLREELAIKYNIRGIPMFLLIDAHSLEVITKDGRLFVTYDPKGHNFPWKNFTIPTPDPDGKKKQVAKSKSKEKMAGPAKSLSATKVGSDTKVPSRTESKKELAEPEPESNGHDGGSRNGSPENVANAAVIKSKESLTVRNSERWS